MYYKFANVDADKSASYIKKILFVSQSGKHTLIQTKIVKSYAHFQAKTGQKPYLLGLHIPMCPIFNNHSAKWR